jgi:hypothetical protein
MIELPVPPAWRVILAGVRAAVGPVGETEGVREMVPAKPLMLVTLIVDVPEDP